MKKPYLLSILILGTLLLGNTSFARTLEELESENSNLRTQVRELLTRVEILESALNHTLIPCRGVNESDAPVGTRCISSTGAVFERVGDGIRSGWKIAVEGRSLIMGLPQAPLPYFEAKRVCISIEGNLPSSSQYELLNFVGLREFNSFDHTVSFWVLSKTVTKKEATYGLKGGPYSRTRTGEVTIYKNMTFRPGVAPLSEFSSHPSSYRCIWESAS